MPSQGLVREEMQRIYRYRPDMARIWRLLMPLIFLLELALLIWTQMDGGRRNWPLTFEFAWMIFVFALVWLSFATTRLIVTQQGIAYQRLGYALYADWNDVIGFQVVTQPGWYYEQEGLTLRQACVKRAWWMPQRSRPDIIPLRHHRALLWGATLGIDLHHFAPWIFTNGYMRPTEDASQSPTPRIYPYGDHDQVWWLASHIGRWAFMSFACAVLITAVSEGDKTPAYLVGAGLLLYVFSLIFSWWSRKHTHLEVAPWGINLHWRGRALMVPWQEMIRFERINQSGFDGWEGITLHEAHWKRGAWQSFFGGYRLPRFIPLWAGRPMWDRELGNDLRYYAPWVFDDAPVSYVSNDMPQRGYYRAEASRAR